MSLVGVTVTWPAYEVPNLSAFVFQPQKVCPLACEGILRKADGFIRVRRNGGRLSGPVAVERYGVDYRLRRGICALRVHYLDRGRGEIINPETLGREWYVA